VLKPYGKTGFRFQQATMKGIVSSTADAEYFVYYGKRYIKLGRGVWNMDLQSSADEKKRAPHLSMSSTVGSLRIQLKKAYNELTSGNDASGDDDEGEDDVQGEETQAGEAAAAAVPTVTPSTPVGAAIKRSPDQQKLYSILEQHVNPDVLNSNAFWKEGSDAGDLLESIREVDLSGNNALSSPLRKNLAEAVFTETIEPDEYLTLKKLEVNITDTFTIHHILSDLYKLDKKVKSCNIFEFKCPNGKTVSLVPIPRSSRLETFRRNDRDQKFLFRILDASYTEAITQDDRLVDDADCEGDGEGDTSDEYGLSREDVARWYMVRFGWYFRDQFVLACADLGMPVHTKPMDPYFAKAMFDKAKLSVKGQEVIRQFCDDFWARGPAAMFPSAKKMYALGNGAPKPTTGKLQLNHKQHGFWFYPLGEIIQTNLAIHCNKTKHCIDDYVSLDITWGGDYGQGSFRAGVTIVLRGPNKFVDEYQVGEIVLRQDSNEALKQSLIEPLNAAILRMTKGEICTGKGPDGKAYIFERTTGDDGESELYVTFNESEKRAGDVLVKALPFRLFIAGDLKFIMVCLGRANADSYWCWLCDLSHAQWQNPDAVGTIWTLESLIATLEAAGGQKVKGVREPPVITCVGPDRYIYPILHGKIGIGNDIIDLFYEYVDKRRGLEQLPESLIEARKAVDELLLDIDDTKEAIDIWSQLHGGLIAQLRMDCRYLDTVMANSALSEEAREDAAEQELEKRDSIKEREQQRTDLKAKLKALKVSLKAKKATLAKEEKDHPKVLRRTRAVMEEELKEEGVDHAAWHGRKLTGGPIQLLMEKAAIIFSKFKVVLLREGRIAGMNEEAQGEVADMCDAVQECFILFDGFFSRISMTTEEVKARPIAITEAKQFATAAGKSLRIIRKNVTCKSHGTLHGCMQMEYHGGIGDFNEQGIERLHQYGKRDNIRTRSMRDTDRKFVNITRNHFVARNTKINEIKVRVAEARRRPRKEDSDGNPRLMKKQRRKEAREKQRMETLEKFVPREKSLWNAANEQNRVEG
jgi:hypothetical protein